MTELPVTQEGMIRAREYVASSMHDRDKSWGDLVRAGARDDCPEMRMVLKAMREEARLASERPSLLQDAVEALEPFAEFLKALPRYAIIGSRGSSNHGCTVEIELPGSGRYFASSRLVEALRAIKKLPKGRTCETLTRLRAAQPADAWRPIESAPKDGTKVRVRYEDDTEEDDVYYSDERWCMIGPPQGWKGPGWVSTEAGNLPVDDPVSWQPLPSPPAMKEGE